MFRSLLPSLRPTLTAANAAAPQLHHRSLHLLGTHLLDHKTVPIALTSFYGIGYHTAAQICAKLMIHKTCKVQDLSEYKINDLSKVLTDMTIESDLIRKMQASILRLRTIGTYRGKRHAAQLPVRGQRTNNNIKTAKKLNKLERKR
ncbi:hypothetical protein YB2330_004493 [Saitoella coloradoensis]